MDQLPSHKVRVEYSSEGDEEEAVVLEDYEDSNEDDSSTASYRGADKIQVNVDMEVSANKVNLGPVFDLCRAARIASFSAQQ
jgi:hypothetical protein